MTHDGYIRIPAADFRSLNLELLDAAVDQDFQKTLARSGLTVSTAGYSEWTCEWADQTVTLGWDWFMLPADPWPLIAPGDIGSNVMLLGQGGYDLGSATSQSIILQSLQLMPWRESLVAHLSGQPTALNAHFLQKNPPYPVRSHSY
jgi:hypothetical protein